jgi:hypothetical protein
MYKLCEVKLLLHVNFVMHKRLNYKLCYLTHEKLDAETCQNLATRDKNGISVVYSAQC